MMIGSNKSNWPFWLLSILLFMLSNLHGLDVTYDSNLYIKGSEWLLGYDEDGKSNFNAKPPLYSVFLISKVLLPQYFIFLQFALFCISIVMATRFIERYVNDGLFQMAVKGMVLLGTPYYLLYHFVWSEALFLPLATGYISLTIRTTDYKKATILKLGLLGLLLVGIRHIGIILLVWSFLVLTIRVSTFSDIKKALISVLPGTIFFTVWQWMIFIRTNSLSRLNHIGNLDLSVNFIEVMRQFGVWIFPPFYQGSIGLFLLIFILISLVIYCLRNGFIISRFSVSLALGLLIVIYTLTIIIKGDLILSDIERYLSIIYLPFCVLFVQVILKLSSHNSKTFVVSNVMLFMVVTYAIVRSIKNAFFWSNL